MSPFRTTNAEPDADLIAEALAGNRQSLNLLVLRHRPYVYNIALKMMNNVPDAEDATQEILIKIITNLGGYDASRARFTTWLYRIVVNHVLDQKKQPYEHLVSGFEAFFGAVAGAGEEELSRPEQAELSAEIEESKLACMSGMLMCLDRPQRIVYILGGLFGIDHKLGADILEISPANYRKRLSRAKADLHQWMHDRCGLVNKANPCRCPKKTRAFIARGWVNPDRLKWNSDFTDRIADHAAGQLGPALEAVDVIYDRLYGQHPFKIPLRKDDVVGEVLGNDLLGEVFGLRE